MEADLETGDEITFAEETIDAIARCSIFVENSRFEEEKKVYVTLKGGYGILSIKAAVGSNKEKVKVKYPKNLDGVTFCLRPDFFAEVLKKGSTFMLCDASLQIKSDEHWCVSALINRG